MTVQSPPTDRRTQWLIRLYYLTFLGGGGFLLPYVTLFFRAQGLSGTEIGLISTVTSVATLIAAPLWGRWSDLIEHPRRLLQISLIGAAVLYLLISQQNQFIWLAILYGLLGLITAGISPLSDALALGITRGERFGSIRLWGSLGWAVVVMISGWLIGKTSLVAAFVGYVLALLLSAAVVNGIRHGHPHQPPVETAIQGRHVPRPPMREMVRALFKDRSLVGLGIALTVLILFTRGVSSFEPIYLRQLGATPLMVGLASTIGATTEIPFMIFADRLVGRFSAGKVIAAGLALQALHMSLVLLAPSVLLIVFIHVIEGVSFSLYAVGLAVFISRRAPGQQLGVMLALFNMTLVGIVSIFAGPFGGMIFDWVGPYWLYAVALAGDLVAITVLLLTDHPEDPVAGLPAAS